MSASCDLPGVGLRVRPEQFPDPAHDVTDASRPQMAVLAGGCFWCVEAVFKELDGVLEVTSGYAGGSAATADYRAVCSGTTHHAEVVEIRFDPAKISFGTLLKVFFSIAHDPTTRDRQGNDLGRQYRSAIFYTTEEQKLVAEAYIRQLDAAQVLNAPIVTEVVPLERFYEAEDYHQDYAERNPQQSYIAVTAAPKVAKLEQHFADRLRRR